MDIRLVRQGPDHTIVAVRGDIDLATADELQTSLDKLLSSGNVPRIGLDLSQVTFLDCSALRALLAIEQDAIRRSLTIFLAAASPSVRRLVALLDLPAGTTFLTAAMDTPADIRVGVQKTHDPLETPTFLTPARTRAHANSSHGKGPLRTPPASTETLTRR